MDETTCITLCQQHLPASYPVRIWTYCPCGRPFFPVDDPRCHVAQPVRIAVPFTFDADNRFSCDFSGAAFSRADCTVHMKQFLLTPLVTHISIDFLPAENTEAAARALAEVFGAFTLTDESGQPARYSEMNSMCSMQPSVTCRDGQRLVRYRAELPGLQAFPASIGFTTSTGDVLRFDIPQAE